MSKLDRLEKMTYDLDYNGSDSMYNVIYDLVEFVYKHN